MKAKKMRSNAWQLLQENWNASKKGGDEYTTFREYLEVSAANDPGFFMFLFNTEEQLNTADDLSKDQRREWEELLNDADYCIVKTTVGSMWAWLTIENELDAEAYCAIVDDLPADCWCEDDKEEDEEDDEEEDYPHGASAVWGLAVDEDGNEYAYFIRDNASADFDEPAYYIKIQAY
jgi:hypothetical protein